MNSRPKSRVVSILVSHKAPVNNYSRTLLVFWKGGEKALPFKMVMTHIWNRKPWKLDEYFYCYKQLNKTYYVLMLKIWSFLLSFLNNSAMSHANSKTTWPACSTESSFLKADFNKLMWWQYIQCCVLILGINNKSRKNNMLIVMFNMLFIQRFTTGALH